MTALLPSNDIQSLQTRFASRMTAALGEQAAALPHDLSERLRVAREQALTHAHRSRASVASVVANAAPAVVGRTAGGAAVLGSPGGWWLKLASGLPLLVLLVGLLFIQQWSSYEQVLAAAEIDSMLLADELPPVAYADPGFAEFLKTSNP